MTTKYAFKDYLRTKPLLYLQVGVCTGMAFWFWDWKRRRAAEEIMIKEEKFLRNARASSINFVRNGEEEDIAGLMDFITTRRFNS